MLWQILERSLIFDKGFDRLISSFSSKISAHFFCIININLVISKVTVVFGECTSQTKLLQLLTRTLHRLDCFINFELILKVKIVRQQLLLV